MKTNCSFPRCIAIVFAAFLAVWFSGRASAVTLTDGLTLPNGFPALSVQWTDSLGLPRTAVFIKETNANGMVNGQIPQGVLYQLTYQTNINSAPVVCTAGVNNGYFGDGFVQNHIGDDNGDSNNNQDNQIPGTTSNILNVSGGSHVIIAFSMPSYYLTTTTPNNVTYNTTVPTTIYWFIADGRSHPIFALSQDARGNTATINNLGGLAADTRSPYGGFNFDGQGGSTLVGGASYGDTYQFVTLAANPEIAMMTTGWTDTAPNTIPYAMLWAQPPTAANGYTGVDAEMGHVATLPISVQDQGTDPGDTIYPDPRGTSDSSMLQDGSWAFQILDDTLEYSPTGLNVAAAKLSWGGELWPGGRLQQ